MENLVLQLFIIHLHIHILSTATMSGVIVTRQIWIDLWLSRQTPWHVLSQDPPYRAHTEPLFYTDSILTVYDLNVNIVGVFMYKYLFEPVTGVFDNYFYTNRDIYGGW